MLNLLIPLFPMWVRERRLHEQDLRETRTFVPGGGFLSGMKIPPWIDPFGNIYSWSGLIANDPAKWDTGFPSLRIQRRDYDKSSREFIHERVIYLSHNHVRFSGPPCIRDIPPLLFSSLFLTFLALWIRNARQRRGCNSNVSHPTCGIGRGKRKS